MIKSITAATVLCLVTGCAWAYGDHLDWDCGDGIMVNVGTIKETMPWRTGVYLAPSNPDASIVPIAATRKKKGEVSFKVKWDFSASPTPKMWLNGKVPLHVGHGVVQALVREGPQLARVRESEMTGVECVHFATMQFNTRVGSLRTR
jgi:hypothetical protein